MPHSKKNFTANELEKELEAPYFCGSCNMGLPDLEEAKRHHLEDEEHLYHVERRVKVMCPGLAMCPACSQMIQNPKNWEAHHISPKHRKCSDTLTAIGRPGDYDRPLGCSSPGQLSGPMDHTKIDVSVATSTYGYGKPFNSTGIPIVGLNFVEALNDDLGKGAKFKCGTCEAEFGFLDRLSHLASVKHRRFYLKKHYREWFETVTENTPKSREKDKLAFYAHKVELLEKDSQSPQAKKLRERFFGLERHLSISISKAKNKETRKATLAQASKAKQARNFDRPLPAHHIDRNDNNLSKFRGLQPFPPAKRYKPGPPDHRFDPYSDRGPEMREGPGPQMGHMDQMEKREAMEAINVLERFSLRQAEQEIRDKMDNMRDAIMRGVRLSEIQGYGAMMSSMTRSGSAPRDRMDSRERPLMDRFSPPRGGILQIPSDRPSPGFPPNRPGPPPPGPPGPILQEDAMFMDGPAGPYRP